jgi:2-polyprenyl-3-methyl-5-hydroxy-6-metoxy-1,4-benzoquinol methylase
MNAAASNPLLEMIAMTSTPQTNTAALPAIPYLTREISFQLPDGSSIQLELLENLNATIDQVFEILEKEGRPELLEVLCPYFGVVWPSARALTEVLSRGQFIDPGMRTLEVGCGLAIPALTLARNGIPVEATDYHPEVPRFLERNRLLNEIPEHGSKSRPINRTAAR